MPQVIVSTNNVRLTQMRLALQLIRKCYPHPNNTRQTHALHTAAHSVSTAILAELRIERNPSPVQGLAARDGGGPRVPGGDTGPQPYNP